MRGRMIHKIDMADSGKKDEEKEAIKLVVAKG
jgi:hypothetical protein